ncbi:MAG TPA: glutamine-hydrolyzing carbamoyl-phosphate synthase small subunit [Solirubrobacterales bacterium]|nr:glutamine-hydrolyzing carbamoyl-phosphate synthase small subunit [Solirubrobacterales bacterium]
MNPSAGVSSQAGYVLLEDGSRFDGVLCGPEEAVTAEVVFNTAMTGYQEAVTDPSYAGQILIFTYPMIGNYGVSEAAMESDRIHTRAVILREARNGTDAAGAEQGWLEWLAANGVTAIVGVDTRALVRHIRDRGSMRGGVFPAEMVEAEAARLIEAEPPMAGADLARGVTPRESIELSPTAAGAGGPHVVALDTGIKRSILDQFRLRGARLTLLPCATPADEVAAYKPDLVFLANGPGDPAALDYVVETIRELIGTRPVVGICLGHQLLCRAVGLETYKLEFGHRGSNHPVKDLAADRVEITSQNHGFAVAAPDGASRIDGGVEVSWDTEFGPARLTHYNLYDGTVEGLTLPEARATTVQYHPEAGPGPRDSRHLFDDFLELTR